MNLLCPACREALPGGAGPVVVCGACGAEVDVTRAATAAGRPRFVPERDRTGAEVAGYRLGVRLGGGGMGTVYRAQGPGGAAAVKFLSPALAGSPDLVARFGREVKMLAELRHEGIVRVLAQGEDGGVPWFAMELVDGEDLRARLARGPLAIEEARALFTRLLAALDHAHQRNIVHRDLKPANVLRAAGGAKLADFGVARWDGESLTGPGAATRLTETAAVIGTLAYMSPEQRRGEAVDGRSDLFSVGVMLYEALTGALPLGAFPLPSAARPVCPRAVDRVVTALLAPAPERRPASAAAAAAALDRALRPSRRRMVAAAAAAMVVATAGGVGAVKRLQAEYAKEPRGVLVATQAARLPPPPAFDAGALPSPAPIQQMLGPETKNSTVRPTQRGGKPGPIYSDPRKAINTRTRDDTSRPRPVLPGKSAANGLARSKQALEGLDDTKQAPKALDTRAQGSSRGKPGTEQVLRK